jgi:hypothetical protein
MYKKTLLFLLLAVTTVAAKALQCYRVNIDGITYEVNPNNYEAQALWLEGATGTSVTIPATIYCSEGDYPGTYSVTSMERIFMNDEQFTDVTIGANIRGIYTNTFYGSKVETITFEPGSKLTQLYEHAFYECRKLRRIINLPTGITTIESAAFEHCDSLESVDIPTGITTLVEHTFMYCKKLSSVYIPGNVKTIEGMAFSQCGIKDITIAEGVNTLESACFSECHYIEAISIPASVTTMTGNPCTFADSLTTITIAEGNPSYVVSDGCIYSKDMTRLVCCPASKTDTFVIPPSVRTIGYAAFEGCKRLTSVPIPSTVASIEGAAFWKCTGLTEIVVPESITTIPYGTFCGCESAASITLPKTITSIGSWAFAGNGNGLKSFTIMATTVPDTHEKAFYNTSIGKAELIVPFSAMEDYQATVPWKDFKTFGGRYPDDVWLFTAKNVEDLEITYKIIDHDMMTVQVGDGTNAAIDVTKEGTLLLPDQANGYTVVRIGDNAFNGCPQLTHVSWPTTLTAVGSNAFKDCSAIESLTIPNGLQIESLAFSGNSALGSVTVGAGTAYDIAADAFDALTYDNATLHVPFSQLDNYLSAQGWKEFKTVTPIIDGSVKMFTYKSVEGVDVTYTVMDYEKRQIQVGGKNAIYQVQKAVDVNTTGTVTIPAKVYGFDVVAVADYAFYECAGLTEVSLPDGITTIGEQAFCQCSAMSAVTLPTSLKAIGSWAFFGCQPWTKLVIPASVESIGTYAFSLANDCKIVMCSDMPPTCAEGGMSVKEGQTLYIPAGTLAAYQTATEWGTYSNIVEYYPETVETFTAMTANDVEMTFKILDHQAFKVQVGDGTNSAVASDVTCAVSIPAMTGSYDVVAIGENAFSGCTQMQEVTIADGITGIGSQAFSGCTALATVNCLSTTAYGIAEDAFDASTYQNAVLAVQPSMTGSFAEAEGWKLFAHIENGLMAGDCIKEKNAEGVEITYTIVDAAKRTVKVGGQPGKYDWQLACAIDNFTRGAITIPSEVNGYKVVEIAQDAFIYCLDITSVFIPKTITAISGKAFTSCSGLSSIVVEDGNPVYDSRNGCNAVMETATNTLIAGCQATVIPEETNAIGAYAFYLQTDLASVCLPEGLNTIGNNAFASCQALKEITIPANVSAIESFAFWGCNSLETVKTALASPLPISSYTFTNRGNATLCVPAGSKAAYEAADYWQEFKAIVEVGDTNRDGKVSITDAVAIVNYILGNASEGFFMPAADVNGDGKISITDAVGVVNIILNKQE